MMISAKIHGISQFFIYEREEKSDKGRKSIQRMIETVSLSEDDMFGICCCSDEYDKIFEEEYMGKLMFPTNIVEFCGIGNMRLSEVICAQRTVTDERETGGNNS